MQWSLKFEFPAKYAKTSPLDDFRALTNAANSSPTSRKTTTPPRRSPSPTVSSSSTCRGRTTRSPPSFSIQNQRPPGTVFKLCFVQLSLQRPFCHLSFFLCSICEVLRGQLCDDVDSLFEDIRETAQNHNYLRHWLRNIGISMYT